jgi:YD repeat-containing protein
MRRSHAFIVMTAIIALFFASAIPSYATVSYTYDDGNRLTRVDYPDGTKMEYTYDDTGSRTLKVITDITAPTGTISINSGAYATNSADVTLTLSCSDPSGCSQMQFSTDNVTYTTPESFAMTRAVTLPTGDGSKTVYAKFKDSAHSQSLRDPMLGLMQTGQILLDGVE